MPRGTILNVNDDEATRWAVTQTLEGAGYRVVEAGTGEEALERVAQVTPDIVILDIGLPEIDGLEVCRRIKADPATAVITVIHLTASRVAVSDKAQALDAGADGYLTSPVAASELTATVGAFMRIREAEARQRFLASASAAMAQSLDVSSSLQQLARISAPFLGEWAVVHELDEQTGLHRVTHTGRDDDDGRLLHMDGLLSRLAYVVHSGELDLRVDGTGSSIALPISARERTLGTLTLIRREGGYREADIRAARDLVRRAAISIDNARLYEEAQRAIRTRENLLALVSHDLKTPLGNIRMANEMISDHVAQSPSLAPIAKVSEVIERATTQMSRLITDLLDLASIEAGQLSMERVPTSLDALLHGFAESHRGTVAPKKIALVVEIEPDLAPVVCDRYRIQQVLANLVSNAVKASPAEGTIRLRAERHRLGDGLHDVAKLSVIDEGAGIRADHLPHLFERFWQASKTARIGTGLGLSIVKGIVEAHRGRVWVDTEVEKGSTFSFTLPFASAD